MKRSVFVWLFLALVLSYGYGDVVINEIYYNPTDDDFESGSLREFIELYNPGTEAENVSGYIFTNGIQFIIFSND